VDFVKYILNFLNKDGKYFLGVFNNFIDKNITLNIRLRKKEIKTLIVLTGNSSRYWCSKSLHIQSLKFKTFFL